MSQDFHSSLVCTIAGELVKKYVMALLLQEEFLSQRHAPSASYTVIRQESCKSPGDVEGSAGTPPQINPEAGMANLIMFLFDFACVLYS